MQQAQRPENRTATLHEKANRVFGSLQESERRIEEALQQGNQVGYGSSRIPECVLEARPAGGLHPKSPDVKTGLEESLARIQDFLNKPEKDLSSMGHYKHSGVSFSISRSHCEELPTYEQRVSITLQQGRAVVKDHLRCCSRFTT